MLRTVVHTLPVHRLSVSVALINSTLLRVHVKPMPVVDTPVDMAVHVEPFHFATRVALTALIALVVFVWIMREKLMADILGLSLVLGGAAGNIDDRIMHGFVVDYADFHIGDFRPFLVFNLADAAITIGVLIILARSFLSREKPEAKAQPGEAA